jgi:hypothetical protein
MKWSGDIALTGKKCIERFGRKPEGKRLIRKPGHK